MNNDINLINAHVITLNKDIPFANSLTIKNNIISAIDNIDNSLKTIDLKGAFLYPGFCDSHFHLKNFGKRSEMLDLKGINNINTIVKNIYNKSKSLKPGNWIIGFGWDQNLWPNAALPNSKILNEIQEYPIALTRIDGHSMWVNKTAIKIAEESYESLNEIKGGKIVNDCILIDNAMDPIRKKLPGDNSINISKWIKNAANFAARMGLTAVHDAWQDELIINSIIELINKNKFPIRCYGMVGSSHINLLNKYFYNGHYNSPLYNIRAVKAFIDGALGSRGAALKKPYNDDANNCGLILISKDEFEKLAYKCSENNFQLCTHAIGDRGNQMVLDIYSKYTKNKDLRWRIEHAQMVSEEDTYKFKDYNILPSMQPSHCTSDMKWVEKRIGEERTKLISKWKTFLDMGIPIPGGSDCPIEDGNPLFEIFAAVTRKDHNGWPENGWHPEECVDRISALKMFTQWGAYGSFSEHQRGIIKIGYDADITILSNDLTTCSEQDILNTEVMMTIVNGKIVYQN